MKNFTNLFKHKTSPLWIRLLIMVFMLIGANTAWSAYYAVGPAVGGWSTWVELKTTDNNKYTCAASPGEFKITNQNGGWDLDKNWDNVVGGTGVTKSNNNGNNASLQSGYNQICFYPSGNDNKGWLEGEKVSITATAYVVGGYYGGADKNYRSGKKLTKQSDGTYSGTFDNLSGDCYFQVFDEVSRVWGCDYTEKNVGESVTLSTSKANKVRYSLVDGTSYIFSFNPSDGTFSVKNSCSAPTSVSISRGTPTSGNICQGSTATLKATVTGGSGDITYKWEKVSGTNWSVSADSDKQTCTVTAGTGEAEFKITATRCSTSKTSTIKLTADTKSALSLTNKTICDGTTINLGDDCIASNTGTVTWYSNSGLTTVVSNLDVTPHTNPTYYYAVAKNGVCANSATQTLTITVDPQPAIELSETEISICNGETVAFTDHIENYEGTVTWYKDEAMSQAVGSVTDKPTVTTTYYAKVVSGVCANYETASLKVTVNDKPAVPTLSADNTSLIYGDKAVFTVGNTVSGLTYTLYNGETAGESQTSTGSDLTFKAGGEGSYTVRVTNSCGTSTSTPAVVITVCTPSTNEFRHANSSYNQLANQPTYYPGDKAYFVSINNCCLTGTWSANLQRGEEAWYTGLTGGTPRFYMTLTRAGEFTITNMATNGCTQDKNVLVNLDFTVTALSQVTNANGTASGADIALTWKHSANHTKVMVVRYPTAGTETIPAGGQSYSAGNTLGDGKVVYVGTAESYTDKNLPSGESYKYYFYTVNNNYYSDGVVLNMSSCPIPAKPSLSSTAITACNGECTAQGYITINNMNDYKDDTYTFKLGSSVVTPDANGRLGINSTAYTQYTVTVTNSCGNPNSATVDIAINDNKPTITGNNSFQPGGSTTLTSDKGASTTWVALDGGDLNTRTGASVVFTAKDKGTYHVQATYNGCSTTYTIKVQDDLYVWVRRPIKKETAYDQFYHKDQNSDASKGGDLFYKEFASLPGDYQQYNQGGKAADDKCTDKDGYTWYGFVVSKTAIENDYYFTVHAPNDKGYGGYHTHTYATQLVDMDADLYFVMDETPSNVNRGWNINAPVVVRASGDAMFNGNNFADFVPLYVKDANICGKEVVSFEWQKSDSQNGTYTTYNGKSGKGINNIRTREAGWYRCVVTYGDGKGTATSNSIQVTNTGGTSYTFTSKLPILMVNTNGVGFPQEPASGFPSVDANNLKAKVSVDVIIKKGNDIVYDRKARMNYRGSSSLNFKKKSYAFVSGQDSCVFDKSRHDYVKTKKEKMLNLLGDANYTTSDKDWVLYAATPDPSMMRNRLVFDLYQQMRPGEWGVHSTYVELIVDGEYQGVYVFMDKITANEGRVNITNSDGFIVKYDKTDVADRVERDGDQKTFATTRTGTKNSSQGIDSYDTKIDQRFEIEYPEKEDIEDAGGNWEAFYSKVQQRFEDFETALEKKDYTTVSSIIDYDSWADWFILTEFIKNEDGFRASNIFIYNGGKIMATPLWDQELSLDNRTRKAHGCESPDGLLSTTSSVYGDAFPAPFWFTNKKTDVNNLTGGLLNDPCFVTLVKTKWAEYQAGVLSASNCSTLVAKYYGELDDNIRSREVTKWPYTQDARGTTNSGKYMGYYNDKEGDPTHYSYNASKNAITSYASKRSTTLDSNSGLGKAINGLKGEALIFTISPSTVETTPWQQVILTVNAPEGYEYTVSYDDLTAAGAIIKEGNNTYGIKIPRPDGWGTAGNGDSDDSEEYEFTANIEVSGENACGTMQDGTATSTITLKDVTEVCDPEIKP